MSTHSPQRYQDTPIDIRLRLSALWVATMFLYAYVDIFGLMRAEHLEGLLDGVILNTPFEVNQAFLVGAVLFITPATLMIPLSLMLPVAVNRRTNIIVAGIYIVAVAGSCIGEGNLFYLLGSAIEVVLLAVLARTAVRWPLAQTDRSAVIAEPAMA